MRRLALFLALTAFVLASACGGEDEQSCFDEGGHWECKDAALTDCRCAAKTSDGGQKCTDSGKCEARCILKLGVCGDDSQEGACERFHSQYDCPVELVHGECKTVCN